VIEGGGSNKLVESKHGKKYKYEVITLPPPETNAHVIEACSLLNEGNEDNEKHAPRLEANDEEVEVLFKEGAV